MKNMVRILAFIVVGLSPPVVYGQEDVLSEFIVDGPRISRTAFTNWDKIELTYTLRYMDGYEPAYENMNVENMNFSPLEIDPDFEGKPLDRRNERTFRKEHYVDVVYHLRHVGEKKGDIIIAQQVFSYIKLEPGKQRGELQPSSVKKPEFLLKYNSTLTKDADDIKDKVEFGSFANQAWVLHRNSVGGFVILSLLALFLIFRHPVLDLAVVSGSKVKLARERVAELQDHLALLNSGAQRLIETPADSPDFHDRVADLHSACRKVLRMYVPNMTDAFTTPQIGEAIRTVEFPWLHLQLLGAYEEVFRNCENYLYERDRSGQINSNSESLVLVLASATLAKKYSVSLQPGNVARQNKLWLFRQRINRLKRVLRWKS